MGDEYRIASRSMAISLGVVLSSGAFYGVYSLVSFEIVGKYLIAKAFGYDEQKDSQHIKPLTRDLQTLFCLGAVISCLTSGILANKIGRRAVIYLAEALGWISCLFCCISDKRFLIGARLGSGISVGLMSISHLYIGEYLPRRFSGPCNHANYISSCIGAFSLYLAQFMMKEEFAKEFSLEIVCGTLLISLVRLLMLCQVLEYDTPLYLYQTSDIDAIFDKIRQSYVSLYKKESINQATFETVRGFENERRRHRRQKIEQGFVKGWKKIIFIGLTVAIVQEVSGFVYLAFYYPATLNEKDNDLSLIMLSFWIAGIVGNIIGTVTIGRLGRKFNLVWGSLLNTGILVVLAITAENPSFMVKLAIYCSWNLVFGFGVGGASIAYLSELAKPVSFGICCSARWIFMAILFQLSSYSDGTIDNTSMLWGFAAVNLLGFFTLTYTVVESRRKTPHDFRLEIENEQPACLRFN